MEDLRVSIYNMLKDETGAGDRVFGRTRGIPESETPYITYYVVNADPLYTHSEFTGITRAKVRVVCWGKTYEQAIETSREVIALQGLKSVNYYLTSAKHEDINDMYDEDADLFYVVVGVRIRYKEVE